MTYSKPELLAPAGGMEQLICALHYGADAVYIGGSKFGLRHKAKNFEGQELYEAVNKVHEAGKKIFVTLNAVMHNEDVAPLGEYVKVLEDAGVDAVIVSDPGAFATVKKNTQNLNIHISTQASVANAQTAQFWHDLGASRIVLARELSTEEIADIRANVSPELELEVFVHGAMCMSYSGRCLISNYLTGRDANRGHCTQPCRWEYKLTEPSRPGQEFGIEEDERGTYIMNSKDLMMLEHLDALTKAGVNSLKVEGRMKGAYYVATIINAYRQVLDGANPADFMSEMDCVSHRPYSTGFFFGYAQQTQTDADYSQTHDLVGVIESYSDGVARFNLRNRITVGDTLEVLSPKRPVRSFVVNSLATTHDVPVDVANRAMDSYSMPCEIMLEPLDILRKAVEAK